MDSKVKHTSRNVRKVPSGRRAFVPVAEVYVFKLTVQIGSVAEETIPNHLSYSKCQVGIVLDMRHRFAAKGLWCVCLVIDLSPIVEIYLDQSSVGEGNRKHRQEKDDPKCCHVAIETVAINAAASD